ncbi:MAG: hypothetical protein AB8G18_15635 [Gammaproteobacteria bacterium]
MAKKKRIPVATGPRNVLHNHPLLRKSGVHQQSAKAKRSQDKINLKKEWSQVSVTVYLWPLFFAHIARSHEQPFMGAQLLSHWLTCESRSPDATARFGLRESYRSAPQLCSDPMLPAKTHHFSANRQA